MPIPINPSGMPSREWKENNDTFGIGLEDLVNAAALGQANRTSSMTVLSEATDADADALLELWKSATVVSEAENAEDKRYAVPKDFPSDKLMRLKAASLVHGDASVIRFTPKAARVIKTVVLSESNAYTKDAVRKPYSVIMAENRAKSATMSTLAFQKNAMVVEAQRNMPIPEDKLPRRNTPYIESRRITNINPSQGHNKQYIVRLFNVGGEWQVVAWNGAIGATLRMHPKGSFASQATARRVMMDLLNTKENEGYRPAGNIEHGDLLGVAPDRPAPERAQPQATPAPAPRATPATRPVAPAPAPAATPTAPKAAPKTEPVAHEFELPDDSEIDDLLDEIQRREDLP